jgi:hypothetical protein
MASLKKKEEKEKEEIRRKKKRVFFFGGKKKECFFLDGKKKSKGERVREKKGGNGTYQLRFIFYAPPCARRSHARLIQLVMQVICRVQVTQPFPLKFWDLVNSEK